MRFLQMMQRCSQRCGRWAWPLAVCLGSGWAMAQQAAWVHGSWVNLRETAGTGTSTGTSASASTASVKAQLTTNTPLQLLARQGEWCSVRVIAPSAAEGLSGYVHCSLIGTEPLTLAQVAQAKNQAGRAFWIAPSVKRLIDYGASLRSGPAYERMYSKLQDGEVARIPSSPEFEAAKRWMAAGVVPRVADEIKRGPEVPPERMAFFSLLAPKPIKRSLFNTQGDVVLLAEGNADMLAAVANSKLSVKMTAPPKGYVARHEGPEISGISGFGDMGDIELSFAPAVQVYTLLPNGLLAGAGLSKQRMAGTPEYGAWCGMQYRTGGDVGGLGGIGGLSGYDDNRQRGLDLKPTAGFPKWPESTLAMVMLVTAQPLNAKKFTIKSRMARVPEALLPPRDRQEQTPNTLSIALPKVVLHEVDLDNDGVNDLLIWDTPSIGSMSGGFNLQRAWYVNIDGRWYAAGMMDDQECT